MQSTAYDYIKHKIACCEYAPNQMLSESQLQEELACSRTPIREAITRLAQEGLLKVLPKKGIVVSGFTFNDINMLFEVRTMIEPYALRNYGSKLDMEELARYDQLFRTNVPAAPDFEAFSVDDAFHSFLLSPLPNIYLRDVYQRIQTQNTRLRVLTGKVAVGRPHNSAKEHLEIIEACLKQDWEAAAQAAIRHLKASRESSLLTLLQSEVDTEILDILSNPVHAE